MDIRLQVLSGYPEELKNRTRVRFHVGTDEVMARVSLLDCDKVQPGDTALAQVILESPTVALPKDRFVIRAFSSMVTHRRRGDSRRPPGHSQALRRGHAALARTAAGGPGGHGRAGVPQVRQYAALDHRCRGGSGRERGRRAPGGGRTVRNQAKSSESRLRSIENAPRDPRKETYLHSKPFDELAGKLLTIVNDYFARNPYRLFMSPPTCNPDSPSSPGGRSMTP